MEVFWLALTAIAFLMALYMLALHGLEKGAIYLVFPLLTAAMYGFRRFLRKRIEKQEED